MGKKRMQMERWDAWLGMELMRQLESPAFLSRVMPRGQARVPWSVMAQVLVLARLCHPSSELRLAEHFYASSALPEVLGAPAHRVNDGRLYRALDQLSPHKAEWEAHLRNRLGQLFALDYDLLLYDVTSTYFEGCYLLHNNMGEWTGEELWQAYMQLTEAEAAFRIHKSDLRIRPIWHQREDRAQAHILVCFLAYVLWKTLGQLCRRAHLGDEPRRVLSEIAHVRLVDVVLPTGQGMEIRKRCVTHPTAHQAILLDRLGLHLPRGVKLTEM